MVSDMTDLQGRVSPYRIAVSDDSLDDLQRRISATRWPGEPADARWQLGMPQAAVQTLVAQWSQFDWRQRERALNDIPQFRVEIDGLPIHFVHVRGQGTSPLPLILTHGWPSSFVEWLGLIGPLVDPSAYGGDPEDSFDLVIPSLPGYGFSGITPTLGMSPRRIADVWAQLMTTLGYTRFGAAGCDWGAYVTALLAHSYPRRVVGAHMGMVTIKGVPVEPLDPTTQSQNEDFKRRERRWRQAEWAYVWIQGTKPQTLSYGLNDSPAGLAAWIAEKWWAWSDNQGDLTSAIPLDTLLTTLSIYWHTGTINGANRLYYESINDPTHFAPAQRIGVPCGFLLERARNQADSVSAVAAAPPIGDVPRGVAELAFNVQRWTVASRGGHFPAIETPGLVVEELREFYRPLRSSART
jgi:pimeloyl-ACP methyl ester carboxylesterase